MNKCFYCNRKIKVPLPVEIGKGGKVVACCGDDCAKKTAAFFQRFERVKVPFCITLGMVFAIFMTSSFVLLAAKFIGSILMGASVSLFGLLFLLFPYATPQTFQIFGIKKTIWIARILSAAVIALGYIMFMALVRS